MSNDDDQGLATPERVVQSRGNAGGSPSPDAGWRRIAAEPASMPKWRALDAFNWLGADATNKFAWSAQSRDRTVTVLTLWLDQIEDTGTTVKVDMFGHPELSVWVGARGNRIRIRHLEDVWSGDREFRVVMIEARDTKADPRIAKARWPTKSCG